MKRDPVYRLIGRRVWLARTAAGLTQYDLADALGVSRPSVQMIERGAQGLQLHQLVAIARALSVAPSELLPPGYWR